LRELAGMLAAPDPQPPKRRPRLTRLHEAGESLFPS
jgi:hypothetical protein